VSFLKFMDNIYNSKELIGRIRKHSRIMLQNTYRFIKMRDVGRGSWIWRKDMISWLAMII